MKDENQTIGSFGPYKLKRKIASGGMAEIYLGETHGPGGFIKPVVVKMIHREYSDDARFVSMFTDEARIVSGFVHGNIVPIFDFGSINGRTYLVMEFIDGVDLEALTETCREQGIPLPPQVALWVGVGTAAALHYAHTAKGEDDKSLGVVHRDVSPHNILVSRVGEVKLCDFGIAFSEINKDGTDAGVIKGKLRYLSPEQAAGKSVDRRCDVFALGVTLYEMLVGHHPVAQQSSVAVLKQLSDAKEYPPLREIASWLPSSIAAVVDKAIAFDPDKRYQTAEEFRMALSGVLYSEYDDFSPQQLANLVVTVQEQSEKHQSTSLDSAVRGQLASFASEIREATSSHTAEAKISKPKSFNKNLWAVIGAVVFALVIMGAVAWMTTRTKDIQETKPPPGLAQAQPMIAQTDNDNEPLLKDTGSEEINSEVDTGSATIESPLAPVIKRQRGSGFLDANASPWAVVHIDGKDHGTTPIMGLKLTAGKHRAVFENPDFKTKITRTFVIRPDKTTRLIVEMP